MERVRIADRPTDEDEAHEQIIRERPDLWQEPVDGKALIFDLLKLLRRYIVMKPYQHRACALWVLHAHTHDAARHSPILFITAPTQECGKSQLLECISYLVPRAYLTVNATPAALFNVIQHERPTILIDEAETFLANRPNSEMQGILNAGWKPDGYVLRKGAKFSTWAPKVIALNGHLHSTIESRGIVIKLQRKLPHEKVERLKAPRDSDNEFSVLQRKCARWAFDHMDDLLDAEPDMPEELGNRIADNWAPLLAIAELCKRPKTAREAALALAGEKHEEAPIAVELFRDLRKLFKEQGSPIASQDIVDRLVQMEGRPWADVHRGRPLTVMNLGLILKPFNIYSMADLKTATRKRANGYKREQFDDVFKRYLQE